LKTQTAINQIMIELSRAETKFPLWPSDPVHAAAIMAEEAGEALRAANNVRWHNGSMAELRKKLIQTGAMVLRCLKNLDDDSVGEFWG